MKKLAVLSLALSACFAFSQDEVGGDIFGAIEANDMDVLRQFISEAPASVSVSTEGGMTPVLYAAQLGRYEALFYLLEAGADVNAVHPSSKTSALHWAASFDKTDCVRLLLSRGADVSLRAKNGFSPLHYAARKGSPETIACLLEAGSPVDAVDRDGNSPLHIAVLNGNVSAIETLLSYSADPGLKNKEGSSPRDLAKTQEVRVAVGAPTPVRATASKGKSSGDSAKSGSSRRSKSKDRSEDLDLDAVDFSGFVNPFEDSSLSANEQRIRFISAPGTVRLEDGSGYYNGRIEKGKFDGWGVLLLNNRERYEGEFRRGVKSGHGTYFYANGDVIEGEWSENAPDGLAEFRYANGCSISGTWRKGVLWNAQGTFQTASGVVCFGVWENGAISSSAPIEQ